MEGIYSIFCLDIAYHQDGEAFLKQKVISSNLEPVKLDIIELHMDCFRFDCT